MKTPRSLITALVAGILILVGCNRGEKGAGAGAVAGKPTIALVVKTLNNPFFIEMQQGAEEAAKRLGVNLVVQAADREVDVERQMQIVENLIERKVNALCIAPSGSREIVPVVVKANKAGIPVLVVDTRVDEKALAAAGGKLATFIGSDNFDGGRIAGAFVAEKLGGQGSVAILEGIAGHETGDARRCIAGCAASASRSPRHPESGSSPRNRPTGSATRVSMCFRTSCRRTRV